MIALVKARKQGDTQYQAQVYGFSKYVERDVSDDQVIRLCEKRDAMNAQLPHYKHKSQRSGRYAVIDQDTGAEVEL